MIVKTDFLISPEYCVTKKESVAMANGIYIEIKRRILDAEEGSIFVT